MSRDITPEVFNLPTWRLDDEAVAALAAGGGGAAASPAAVAALLAHADGLLGARPWTVTDKKPLPPSGDRRDYMSLAIYVWPNTDTPDGLPYVHRDGLINPEIHDYDRPRFSRLASAAETLALAAACSGRAAYALKAAEILRVWFLDDATAMRPHLNYGQFVPGECEGRCYGIIETVDLIRVVNAVRLLEALDGADAPRYGDGQAMRQWFVRYAHWLMSSELGRAEAATANNHRAWHVVQTAAFLLFAEQHEAARRVLAANVADILETQMADDGSFPRELARTRSFHYSVFVLVPLLMAAEMGRTLGLEMASPASPAGAALRRAVDWLEPYLAGRREWTWQQIVEEDPSQDVYPILRVAAKVLGDARCEAALKTRAGAAYEDLLLNLLLPVDKYSI